MIFIKDANMPNVTALYPLTRLEIINLVVFGSEKNLAYHNDSRIAIIQ